MDHDLRTLERAVALEPTNGRARLALWNAQLRAGVDPVPENVRGIIPEPLDDSDWEEVFGAAGEPGRTVDKDVKCVKHEHQRPGPAVPGDTVSTDAFARTDVRYLFARDNGEPDGPNWVALLLLWDGRFAAIRGGCDYSGWG